MVIHKYHLQCSGEPRDTWRHYEIHPSNGGLPIAFDFYWIPLYREVPALAGDQAEMLPALLQRLAGAGQISGGGP